jgi:dihydroorotase
MNLIDVLRRLTVTPARILGLAVGTLAAGAPADFVVFDPKAKYRVETDRFRSKSKNAPFDGRPVQGRVELTVVDGRTIFERAAA